jgi:membrane-associated phospholipid phosphatase
MPELPDLTMYLEALDARTRGQTLERVTAVSPFVVRSVEPPFSALAGRSPLSFALIGKRLVVGFEGDLFLVMHLMVSGRLQWHTTRPKIHRRLMMAVFDFPAGTLVLTEAGTKRRASIYVVRGAAALEQFAHGGLDPMAVTDTLKVATGYPRPNLFAYCDYAGRRLGNMSAYLAATDPDVLGDVRRCLAPEADVHDAQLSFPSGHASLSFAGMTLTTLFARRALGVRPGAQFSLLALLAASPLILAAWIAVTRVRDRYHNPIDVVAGAVLGALGGRAAWRHLEASGRAALVPALWPPRPQDACAVAAAGDAAADGGPVHVMLEQ